MRMYIQFYFTLFYHVLLFYLLTILFYENCFFIHHRLFLQDIAHGASYHINIVI